MSYFIGEGNKKKMCCKTNIGTGSPSPSFVKSKHDKITLLSERMCGGTYVLRMVVQRNLHVRFGRFKGGQQIAVEQGTYVYVGSAMGTWQKLGQRLARHASRSGVLKSQKIREDIVAVFGEDVLPKGEKRLRWHVDFLLDRLDVDVTHIVAVCSDVRLEGVIADRLMTDEMTQVLTRGLGASDAPGKTHLLRVPNGVGWWQAFLASLGSYECRKDV